MKKTILFAAGGTGGHIYPALAMAKAVKAQAPDVEIHFAGTSHGLEGKIIPKENYPISFISVGQLNNVSKLTKIKTLFKLPFAILQSLLLIIRLKPLAVVGVGGYVTGPVLLAAWLLRKKTMIWEPNAYPGMANRLLSGLVDLALVVFDETLQRMKVKKSVKIGMPVRKEIEEVGNQNQEAHEKFHVLIFGGSQGAKAINEAVSEAIIEGGDWSEGVSFVHQTGARSYEEMVSRYGEKAQSSQLEVQEYLHNMPERYSWADIVVCRCGTGTLFELAACAKPGVLVPYPFAADNHQQKNAEALADKKASLMVLQKDFTAAKFKEVILSLKKNKQELLEMSENIKQFYEEKSAEKIASLILGE